MLKEFDQALPELMGNLSDVLTPDAQKAGTSIEANDALINKHIFKGEKDKIQDDNVFFGSPFGGKEK